MIFTLKILCPTSSVFKCKNLYNEPEIKLVKQAILSESTHNSPVNCDVNSCTNTNSKTVKRDIPIYQQNQRSSRMVRLAATCMCCFAIENTVKVASD